jgi:hypothetical protein
MPRFRIPAMQENVSASPRRGLGPIRLAPPPVPPVRRALSRESAQGVEILGHAIEYLADEYAVDLADKGPLGNADPRIAAIQILKSLNRVIYFSGAEVQPAWQRVRQWFLRSTMSNVGPGNGH